MSLQTVRFVTQVSTPALALQLARSVLQDDLSTTMLLKYLDMITSMIVMYADMVNILRLGQHCVQIVLQGNTLPMKALNNLHVMKNLTVQSAHRVHTPRLDPKVAHYVRKDPI